MTGAVNMLGQGRIKRELDTSIKDLLPSVEFRHMVDNEDREAVMRMRLEGYRKSFPVNEGWNGFNSAFDEGENSKTFGIFMAGQLASTIQLTIATQACPHSQATAMFGDDLLPRLAKGHVLLDVTRLVVNPRLARQIPELPYLTFRLVAMACEHYKVTETISALRTKHVPFYKRYFGGVVVGDTVEYPSLNSGCNLVVFPLNAITADLSVKFTSWQSTYLERRQLFGPVDGMPGIAQTQKIAA